MVECTGLENRSTRKGTVGSNPTLSAKTIIKQLIIKVIFEITRFDPQRYPQQVLSLIVG